MVIVDTSTWISLYREKDAELGQMIWMLTARNEAAVTGHERPTPKSSGLFHSSRR